MLRLLLPALFLLAIALTLPGCKSEEPSTTTRQSIGRPSLPKVPAGAVTAKAG